MTKRKPPEYIVEKYVEDVLSDRILTCVSVKAAVKRFVHDIAKQGTDEFPFVLSAADFLNFS